MSSDGKLQRAALANVLPYQGEEQARPAEVDDSDDDVASSVSDDSDFGVAAAERNRSVMRADFMIRKRTRG